MLSTAEANQHIWWTHVEHSPSITERCERSSFWFNVFSRPLFFLTLLELSLECNTMWWDITANSTCKICQKNHLYHLHQFTCCPHFYKRAWHFTTTLSEQQSSPWCIWGDIAEMALSFTWKDTKTLANGKKTVVLSSLRGLCSNPLGALASTSKVWLHLE